MHHNKQKAKLAIQLNQLKKRVNHLDNLEEKNDIIQIVDEIESVVKAQQQSFDNIDVADRKKVLSDLAESENRFKMLANLSFEGIFIHKNGKIIDANKQFYKITEYTKNELAGTDIYQLLFAAHKPTLDYLKGNETAQTMEVVVYKKNNQPLYAEIQTKDLLVGGEKVQAVAMRDISMQKKRIEEIEKLSTAVEQSANAIVITNKNGLIEFVNQAFVMLTGYSEAEACGKDPSILNSGHHPKSYFTQLWDTILSGKQWTGEFLNKKANGELFWENATITPIKNTAGEVIKFLAVKENITDRKKTEEALIESEKRYRTLVALLSEGILLFNKKGEIIEANDAAASILGKSTDALKGKMMFTTKNKYFDETGQQIGADNNPVTKTFETKEAQKQNTIFVQSSNDKKTWISLNTVPVLDRTKSMVKSVILSFADISVQKNAQLEISNRNKQLEALTELRKTILLDSSEEILLNNFCYAIAEIMKYNTAWIGYSNRESTHEVEVMAVSGAEKADTEAIVNIVNHKKDTKCPVRRTIDEKKKIVAQISADSNQQWQIVAAQQGITSIASFPVTIGKNVIGAVVIYADKVDSFENQSDMRFLENMINDLSFGIETIRLRNERLIASAKIKQQNEELSELNATKDKFFSIVAHDLKNPFSTIIGYTELLINNFTRYSEDKQKRFIKNIYQGTRQTYNLLENLLMWSRTQTNRLKHNPQIINILSVVNDCVEITQPSARKKRIVIETEMPGFVQAYADKDMVETIVRNLLSNAVKFTPEEGKIFVIVDELLTTNKVKITVTDTGVGIAEENLKKLFKLDKGFTTEGTNHERGTGLGLLLCKEFAQKNRGDIKAKSKIGKGSSFTLTLPAN